MQTATEWSPSDWIKSFCELGGLVIPEARVIKWSDDVTDFENFPTDMNTLAAMSRSMIELDSGQDRRNQVFAFLGG